MSSCLAEVEMDHGDHQESILLPLKTGSCIFCRMGSAEDVSSCLAEAEMDLKHNQEFTAWYSSTAMPFAEDIPVPSGAGVHGCLAMCGPSQVMSPNTNSLISNPPGTPTIEGTGTVEGGSSSWTSPMASPTTYHPGAFAGGGSAVIVDESGQVYNSTGRGLRES